MDDICGLSMSAEVPRKCIRERCHHWKSIDQIIGEYLKDAESVELSPEEMLRDQELLKDELGDGFCKLECRGNGE